MDNLTQENKNRQVANWLLIGVVMLIIQVLLGGITRLTESGLSITEWKPLTGALPPLNAHDWQIEFDKYRNTDQFKYVHQSFNIQDFKFIFFWEWFHRLWARLMGLVFLGGFIYFIARQAINRKMIFPLVMLFILGALQGAIGWIMVKSGLVPEKYFVGHIELTTHLIAAIILLGYTLWFALSLLSSYEKKVYNTSMRKFIVVLFIVLFLQLIYGGFMAGLKAGPMAPTWPNIQGKLIPNNLSELSPWYQNLSFNKIMVQFVHRGLGYLLFILTFIFYIRSATVTGNSNFRRLRAALLSLVILQVFLGITTLMNSTYTYRLVWLGVTHQFTAIVIVMVITSLLYLVRKKPSVVSP